MPVLLSLRQSGWTKMAKAAALLESGSNLFRMMLPIASVRSISFIRVRIEYRKIFPNGKIFLLKKASLLDFPVRESYTENMKIMSVESISEAVKNRRKQLGLTQSETAAMCNVGARFFSELENGKETLQMNKVLHCLEMLGINLYAVNREDDTGENK